MEGGWKSDRQRTIIAATDLRSLRKVTDLAGFLLLLLRFLGSRLHKCSLHFTSQGLEPVFIVMPVLERTLLSEAKLLGRSHAE
jgi:hypothetical protein